MAIKFECSKCGKRFVDWGAEKLGFKCPECDDQELVRVGSSEDSAPKRASLKRTIRKKKSPGASILAAERAAAAPALAEGDGLDGEELAVAADGPDLLAADADDDVVDEKIEGPGIADDDASKD